MGRQLPQGPQLSPGLGLDPQLQPSLTALSRDRAVGPLNPRAFPSPWLPRHSLSHMLNAVEKAKGMKTGSGFDEGRRQLNIYGNIHTKLLPHSADDI